MVVRQLVKWLVLTVTWGTIVCGLDGRCALADDERTAWLKTNAAALRSIDPADADFSDLEPICRAIGQRRIVMLGEQTHGDGATFLAKTRLIRFLHEECGFDVLAFESGLYDCHKAWQLLRGGELPPHKAFSAGVFAIWAQSQQVQPLIEYLQAQAGKPRRLELAGFDCQFTAEASSKYLPDELAAFFKELPPEADQSHERDAVVEACRLLAGPPAKIEARHKEAFAAVRKDLEDAAAPPGVAPAEYDFWKQFLKSAAAYAEGQRYLGTKSPDDNRSYTNVRDPQMADNLVWLARSAFPDRKIIVWAASMHLTRNPAEIKLIAKVDGRLVEPWTAITHFDKTETMGHVAWRELSNEIYSLAFTAAEGQFKLPWWSEARQLDPVLPGSLEALLCDAGFDLAFLDFRNRGDGGAWLCEQLASRPLGHADSQADWTQVFDGLVFTRTMTGSDQVKRAGKLVPHRSDDPAIRKELARFQGDWKMTANESNGAKLPADRLDAFRRVVKDDTYTLVIRDPSGTNTVRGRFALNPRSDPPSIDAEPEQGELMLGIYKLDGDTLTVCFSKPGEPRPTALAAGAGTGVTSTTWQRTNSE